MPTLISVRRPAAFSRGADRKAQVGRGDLLEPAPRRFEQGADAGDAAAGANPPQSLRDQDPVIAIERNHVGHGSERDQIQQIGRAKLRLAQFPAERRHHVERHADTGQRRTGEGRSR